MRRILFYILLAGIIGGFSAPTPIFAACPDGQRDCRGVCIDEKTLCLNLVYPQFPGAPDLNKNQNLASIVAWFYVFFVGISGLAAFVMIVWGGVEWLTSQGSPEQTTSAKDKIKMALLGLLLVLASFLILQVINPELTLLQTPRFR